MWASSFDVLDKSVTCPPDRVLYALCKEKAYYFADQLARSVNCRSCIEGNEWKQWNNVEREDDAPAD